MDEVALDQGLSRLRAIGRDIADLRGRLAGELPVGIARDRIRSGLAVAMSEGSEGFFQARAGEASGKAFNAVCAAVRALPEEHGAFVASALRLVGAGPGQLARWTRRLPHPYVMPEVLKAFELAIGIVLAETPADADFRRFHLLASRFLRAALKARYGRAWDEPGAGEGSIAAYDAAAGALRDEMRERFAGLDGRYVRLMDDRLSRYRPLTFHPDLAPVGHVNTAEERARIVAMNERALEEARAYGEGRTTIAGAVGLLATDGREAMADRAGIIVHAADLYFADGGPLLTLDVDGTGAVRGLSLPEPDAPTRH